MQVAAFAVRETGVTVDVLEAGDGGRLRCASALKPLTFWAAAAVPPLRGDPGRWAALARPAVVTSENGPTVEAWAACGGEALLGVLRERCGGDWPLERGGPRSFGRVLVTAGETAAGYAAFARAALDGDREARALLGWMREVPEEQTFGAREAAAAALGVAPARVAVKTGWFCAPDETHLRTHAVTIAERDDGTLAGTVVLTRAPLPAGERRRYTATYDRGPEVLAWHREHGAPLVVEGTRRAALRA